MFIKHNNVKTNALLHFLFTKITDRLSSRAHSQKELGRSSSTNASLWTHTPYYAVRGEKEGESAAGVVSAPRF